MTLPAHAQDVLAPPAKAAIFLVAKVRPGAEDPVRGLLADVAGLTRAVGFREPEGELSCVVGVGADLWDRLYDWPRPAGLHRLPVFAGAVHTAVSTSGDLMFHLRARRLDLCFELGSQLMNRLAGHADVVDEVHGFRFFDERDMLGFVDGTESPRGAAAAAAVFVGEEDPAFVGGSYVVVQKYLHDLDGWNALSVEEQERAFGRHKLTDIEFPDAAKPTNSHLRLNTIADPDGTKRQIVRDNMPFGSIGAREFGTYYIGYAATPDVIERMLHNMFVGGPPGNHDRILDFSTAVTGALFFVPTADFLEDPAPASGSTSTTTTEDAAARRLAGHRRLAKERHTVNNLYRELAPISDGAWAQIEEEASRTFKRNVAGRRAVDVVGPAGLTLSAVGTGHLRPLQAPAPDVQARQREVQPLVELRAPFTVTRLAVDDVERGAQDSDWQPVKDAAKQIAFAEDHTIFHGFTAAGIAGIAPSSSNPPLSLPPDIGRAPDTVAQALSALRLAGVDGPYSLLLSAELYTAVAETTDHGYPIREHLVRLLPDGEVLWAPALDAALLVSTRGGDYELHLGQDLSIGYQSHDADHIELYLQESLTFLAFTAEASVPLRVG